MKTNIKGGYVTLEAETDVESLTLIKIARKIEAKPLRALEAAEGAKPKKRKKHQRRQNCDMCGKEVKGKHGLGIHRARSHKGYRPLRVRSEETEPTMLHI